MLENLEVEIAFDALNFAADVERVIYTLSLHDALPIYRKSVV